MRRSLLLVLPALAWACSSDPVTPDAGTALPDASPQNDASSPVDAGPQHDDAAAEDAAPDDAAETPDLGTPDGGAFADAEAPCVRDDAGRCPLVTWTATAAFPVAVDHHTTFVATSTSGAFVTVVGGVRNHDETLEEVYTAVRRAPILGDGQLGPFEDMLPLPTPKAFHAQAVDNGFVYLLAGVTADAGGPGASAEVIYGHIDGSSRVREWRRGTRLPPAVRLHASASVIGRKLYLIGGSGANGVVLNVVSVADIMDDGSIGTWSVGAALPTPRSHHAAVVWQGHVYLVGGFTTDQAEEMSVLRSVNDESGVITGWETAGMMMRPPWTHAAFVRNDHVYVVGGGEGSGFFARYVNRVRRAALNADGTVGEFEDVGDPLPRARSHVHHAPYYLDHIYSIGGRNFSGLRSLAEQTVATFRPQ